MKESNILEKLYGTVNLPIKVEKPWGHEIIWAYNEEYCAKILCVKAKQRLSLQYHNKKKESNILVKGKLLLIKGPNVINQPDAQMELNQTILEPGAVWENLPGDVHTIEGIDDCEIYEVSTIEIDDVVRISDNYGREGTDKP